MPSAISAGLVHLTRRILAICGDGGFLMNVQVMETARRLGVSIVVMVWEDGAYGLISWKQEQQFNSHTTLEFTNPDWLELSRAFGWHGHVVTASRDLEATLEAAFEEEGPSLVVVPIDYEENMRLIKHLGEIVCPI